MSRDPYEAAQRTKDLKDLGEIFSGEPTEYFGPEDTPTHSLVAVNPITPPPVTEHRKKLLDYVPARFVFSNPDFPIYVLCNTCIEMYFFKYNAYPKRVCIHKSKFEELVTGIVRVHQEAFVPNFIPYTHGTLIPRCEYIAISLHNQIAEYSAICLDY
jgi:hypothetical protein